MVKVLHLFKEKPECKRLNPSDRPLNQREKLLPKSRQMMSPSFLHVETRAAQNNKKCNTFCNANNMIKMPRTSAGRSSRSSRPRERTRP